MSKRGLQYSGLTNDDDLTASKTDLEHTKSKLVKLKGKLNEIKEFLREAKNKHNIRATLV